MPLDVKLIFDRAIREECSDIHLHPGEPPVIRKNNLLMPLDMPKLAAEDTESIAREIMSPADFVMYEKEGELDFSYSWTGVGNFG